MEANSRVSLFNPATKAANNCICFFRNRLWITKISWASKTSRPSKKKPKENPVQTPTSTICREWLHPAWRWPCISIFPPWFTPDKCAACRLCSGRAACGSAGWFFKGFFFFRSDRSIPCWMGRDRLCLLHLSRTHAVRSGKWGLIQFTDSYFFDAELFD